jgi:hypothetical protein
VFGKLRRFELLELDLDRLVLGLDSGRLQFEVHIHDRLRLFARTRCFELLAGLLNPQCIHFAANDEHKLIVGTTTVLTFADWRPGL